MTHYIALIHEESGVYGVLFPDFPGCVSAGDNFDDVVRNGADALAFHVAGMREDRDVIPPPRTLEAIRTAGDDWIDWSNAIIAAVPLLPPDDETERVNVTLSKRLLAQIDAVATNRSKFLAEASRKMLG